ncbi:DUF4097 family beta strand repeat-containing protein [Staphylococcus sp. NRL 16/872]|uniref:DUF4097 family beta strand repeat-containing protein n=1 Tax=Staphylococcus sp. NRL 16/872 TaxID=2930131 RepID=UPI001FB338D0|nr:MULTISPECIES: DUF4097 family beta strand repeat-containing protein [unclassified Staphylococcus]MCJ1655987.1 DUF4097 domain-containing protein [Staphylococcus sp. NRL 21/187]MCJ1661780.1 DUF4097 domain-containing protein [Staphylococcus sp. NRL 18/288]WEN70213.1 DUF4097 family beta strand repeat-containing protein [Staphylococcus sp. NRL 16/872]
MKKAIITGLVIFIGFFLAATLVWFVHDKEEYKKLKYNKEFTSKNLNTLNIDSFSSDIAIKKGNRFNVKYVGDNDVKVSTKKNAINIKERRAENRGYSFNVNPFNLSKSTIYITIPEKGLKKMQIDADMGEVMLDNLKVNEGSIYKEGEDIYANHSELDDINIENGSGDLVIKNSLVRNIKSKLHVGSVKVNNSKIQNSIFLSEIGYLKFTDMHSESDLKGSSKQKFITMSYKEKPKDTLLKLHPGTGKAKVENRAFKNGKVGKSKNIVEFYTVKYDITIK